MGGEFELPEHTIHHIQSFLSGKEAVRTSVLSKSWHHPNLDFDEEDFSREDDYSNSSNLDEFLKFVNKTIKRYEERKLKVDGLRLRLHSSSVLPKKLIPQALSMVATHLDIGGYFVVPKEVFKAENLVRLSMDGCEIKRNRVRVVKYPLLESLSLTGTVISWGVSRIISGCPSIKTLSLTSIIYSYRSGIRGRICCHTLTTLVLCNVFFHGDDLSSKFPSLRALTIQDPISKSLEIRVSSRSLERLKLGFLEDCSLYTFKLNLPSLRKLTFDGSLHHHTSLVAPSTSRDRWVSCLTITEKCGLSTTWFKKLGDFLALH